MSKNWKAFELTVDRVADVKDCKEYCSMTIQDLRNVFVLADNKILLRNNYDKAWCVDTTTGKTLWNIDKINGIIVQDGIIYGNIARANICAFDSDGKKLWTQNVSDTTANITVSDSLIFTHTYSNAVCIDKATGKALWRTKLKGNTQLNAGVLSSGAYMVPYIPQKKKETVIAFLNKDSGALEKSLDVGDMGCGFGFVSENVAYWTPGMYNKEYIVVDTASHELMPGTLNIDNAEGMTEIWIHDMKRHNGKNYAVLVVRKDKLACPLYEFTGNNFKTIIPDIRSTGFMTYGNNQACMLVDEKVQVFNLRDGSEKSVTFDEEDAVAIAVADGTVFAAYEDKLYVLR